MFLVFVVEEAFFWIIIVSSKRPTLLFSQRLSLPSTWDFISDVLHLFEVICDIRDNITIKALKQISWFGDFEAHSFISFASLLIKAFPGAPIGRPKRFLFQCTNSLFALSLFLIFHFVIRFCVYYHSSSLSWINAWSSIQNCLKLPLTSWARNWKFLIGFAQICPFCSFSNCSSKYQLLFLQVWLYASVYTFQNARFCLDNWRYIFH